MTVGVDHRMVLYPEQADYYLSKDELISILMDTGLLGEAESDSRFLPGQHFLNLICFLGCSPNIELMPNQDNRPYCSIEVNVSPDQICCQTGSNTRTPVCPVCRTELAKLLQDSLSTPCHLQQCPECLHELDLTRINWRKSAVFARTWITIHNIFEAEAVPHDDLLDHLRVKTGYKWKTAYLRSAT